MPPIINTFDPMSAASDAIGAYAQQKRSNALDAAAQSAQQQQLSAETKRDAAQQAEAQHRSALDDQKFAYQQQQDAIGNAASQAAAELSARKEADAALHQAREDALAAAKERDAKQHNDRQFALEHQKIEQTFKAEIMKLQNARDVATIRAQAETGAANIHAAAEVQAASIHANATLGAAALHENGADRRAKDRNGLAESMFDRRDATTRRGQNLTTTTRTAATNASNHRAMLQAMLRLSLSKGAPKAPTADQDPHFAEAMKRFMTFTPEQRAAAIASPNMPAPTKAYLQAITGLVSSAPAEVEAPAPDESDNEVEQ